MASKVYPKGIQAILRSTSHLQDGAVKLVPVDGNFVFDAANEFYTDISASVAAGCAGIALSAPLVSVSGAQVKFDADDANLLWSSVTDVDNLEGAVVYYDTGDTATSFLIAFLDSVTFVTSGSDVFATLNASGIFGGNT